MGNNNNFDKEYFENTSRLHQVSNNNIKNDDKIRKLFSQSLKVYVEQ